MTNAQLCLVTSSGRLGLRPLFAQQNGVSKGGLKARKRKENIKPRKQRKKETKK